MKFLIDKINLWRVRRMEREEGSIFDDVLEMLRKQHFSKYVSRTSVRGKTYYFVKDEGRLRRLIPPSNYKCKGCGYVKGLADVEAIAHSTEETSIRYSCRVCKRVLYEDVFDESSTEEAENYSQG